MKTEAKKYKVMGDSKNAFMGIELDLVLTDDSIGADCSVLNGKFKITQNGKILVLAEKEWTLTLMDITPVPEKDVPKLVINDTLEIYFETKEIAVKCKCTYEELYYALREEWKMAGKLVMEPLPFDYSERLQLFTFKDDWGFENGNFSLLTGGSFSRIGLNGRNI